MTPTPMSPSGAAAAPDQRHRTVPPRLKGDAMRETTPIHDDLWREFYAPAPKWTRSEKLLGLLTVVFCIAASIVFLVLA